jgi:uncharacterized protein YdhG (YjbR/CyaY superfamily)
MPHALKIEAATVPDYLAQLPDDRRMALDAIRTTLLRIWPALKEDMAYGMPTFHLDGHALAALASQKSFMAVYIMPYDLLVAFKNELKLYDTGRSCIRFTRLTESEYLGRPGNVKSYSKSSH